MTLNQFSKLSKDEQKAQALLSGAPLMQLENGRFAISLYQVDGFYIELFLLKQTNQTFWINSFDDTSGLTRYLEKIDLAPLSDCLSPTK